MEEKQTKKSTGRKGGRQPGAGRPKGSLDKGNATIRQMVVQALDGLGGVKYLQEVAQSNPTAFLSLVGKVMPVQVEGSDGGPIKHAFEVKFVSGRAD